MSNEVYPALSTADLRVVPEWRTVVKEYASGVEQRDARWLIPRFRFELEYDPLILAASWRTLTGFYMRRRGRYENFLFQDYTTLKDHGALGARTGEDLGLGTGSRTEFWLYEDVVTSAVIYKDDVVQSQGATPEVVVDPNTGKVTFTAAPAANARITADVVGGYFRVRFDMDGPDWDRIRGAGWRGRIALQQVPRATG